MTNEEMEMEIKRVTSRLTMLDEIIKSERLGEPKMLVFRCSHSGKLFPGNYAKEWGRTTGIGLGEDVVSETLDSLYHVSPPPIESVSDPMDLMHPLQSTMAQVDLLTIPTAMFAENALILHHQDKNYSKRKAIIHANQMRKSGSRIAAFMAEWARINGNEVVQ